MLRAVRVHDPTEPLRHSGDQCVDDADLMDPARWVARQRPRRAEQLAGPAAILREDRLRAELRQNDVDAANVCGPLPSLDQDHRRNHEDLAYSRQRGNVTASRGRVSLSREDPACVHRDQGCQRAPNAPSPKAPRQAGLAAGARAAATGGLRV